ncbi:winged helix-turn-helix domain-containing protein [Luteimonas saliphila]|uniref:winged helix-turn-helix domain-containing protein n=1 Tax=Luteimonas saliphila TaxID=2804919 RepID=UPI001EE2897C|nr:winged helix-turn-helix domain-containing protein [Luteimonas saliphila]
MRRIVSRPDRGEPMRVTVKAMQVLLVLVERRGTVVARSTLLERVWPDTMPTDDVVTQAIAQLRKAFGDDRESPRYIETIAKAGYRLIAEVQWQTEPDGSDSAAIDGEPATPAAAPPPAVLEGGTDDMAEPAARVPRAIAAAWPTLVLAAVLLLAIVLAFSKRSPVDAAPLAGDTEPQRVVAPIVYRAITSTPGLERLPALSPDGATVAFAQAGSEGEGSTLMLQEVAQASARSLTTPEAGHSDVMPVWSRDGTRIAFVRVTPRDCRIMIVASSGGEAREAGRCLRQAYSMFDWTPDGRGIVMGGLRSAEDASAPLQRLDLANGRWQPLAYGIADGDVDLMPRYSPDGRWLAFRRNISLADLWLMPAGGGTPRRLTNLRGDIRGWDWLPDGSGLVFSHVTSEAGLYVYRLADGSIDPLPTLSTGNAVHPDLAAGAWSMVFEIDQSRSGLFRVRIDGEAPEPAREPLFESSGVDMLPAISPDGRTLAFISDRTMAVQLWLGQVGRADTLRAIEGLRPVPRHLPVWSADGRTLLVLGKTGDGDRVFEVDAGSGRVRRLAVPDANPVFAAYTGDPDRLLVGVDGGQGRIRLVLYARVDWREIASIDDVAVARYDATGDRVFFTRPSKVGLWRADPGLREATQVSEVDPAPQHYRHWGVFGGRPFYNGPGGGCATSWRPLLESDAAGACVSRDGVAIAGSPSVDGTATWLYLGLPMAQNIDIGWAALPVGLRSLR